MNIDPWAIWRDILFTTPDDNPFLGADGSADNQKSADRGGKHCVSRNIFRLGTKPSTGGHGKRCDPENAVAQPADFGFIRRLGHSVPQILALSQVSSLQANQIEARI